MKKLMLVVALGTLLTDGAWAESPQKLGGDGQSGSDVEQVFVYLAVRSNRTPGASDPACNDGGLRSETETIQTCVQ